MTPRGIVCGPPAIAGIVTALAGIAAAQDSPAVYTPHVEQASAEARAAIDGFHVPEGFAVELFAAEPLLANPVCFYPDDSGAFYVAETFRHHAGVTDIRDHMDWLDEDVASRSVEDRVAMFRRHLGDRFPEYEVEHERVRILRDTDGDGVADVGLVFADGFNEPAAGIGAGLLSRKRDVYYTCIPSLWLLRDTNGDGCADERQVLSTGYGVHVALLGHDLHGLRIGHDGKLYFSSGDRGFRVETPRGVIEHAFTGAVLRCNLDGSKLEVFASGLRNPQELAFDEWGNLFTCDNNSDGGDRARVVHVVEGGDSGWRYAYQWLTRPNLRGPWNEEQLWVPHFEGQAAYIVPPIANLADGPSGFTHDPGTGFSSAYAGRFFLCDFTGNPSSSSIHAFALVPKGAGFALGQVERFLSGALVTDCDFAPDGALYFTDWVQGWNKTGKGRLYRIEDGASDRPGAQTRQLLAQGFDAFGASELARFLEHADQRVRQEAQFELVARGASGLAALRAVAADARSTLGRVHGIWGLGMALERGASSTSELYTFLSDSDAEVRAQAARVLGDLADRGAQALLIARLADPSPRVKLFAALALARVGSEDAVEPLITLAHTARDTDVMLRHAAILGLSKCASPERLIAAERDSSPHIRMAALVALRRQEHAGVAAYLGDSDPRIVLEAARAIYDVPIEAGLEELADLIRDPRLADPPLARRVLAANFRLGDKRRARELASFALRGAPAEGLRREALDLLAKWKAPPGRDVFDGAWRPIEPRDAEFLPELVRELDRRKIGDAPVPVVAAWIRLCTSAGAREVRGRLLQWADDTARPAAIRAEALRALAVLAPAGLEDTLRVLLADRDGEVRAAALAAYQVVAPEKVMPLLESALKTGELFEQRVAYQALGGMRTPEADKLVTAELEKLEADLVPVELALDLVLAAEQSDTPEIKTRLQERMKRREVDPSLAKYLDSLAGGDAERGAALFREKAEIYCMRCHRVNDAPGSEVGPDLRGVSQRLTRLSLLESILEPNRKIARGYESTSFFLKDDTHVEGRVIAEDADVIRVQKSDGNVAEIEPGEVATRKPALSGMPQGFGAHLSRVEMRDLIEYLARL